MAFIDEYNFRAVAGKGGDGVVRWRREKYLPKGGPNGGNGGRGGDVIIEAVRDIMMLTRIAHKDTYKAEGGQEGGSNSKTGADGPMLIIKLPIGSVVTNTETNTTVELLHEGERHTILKGGVGGKGNEHFKSSTNVAPQHATKGETGEEGLFHVELRLIADVGLVGLPNAGKSSLLNELTNASAKVGAYPFTTLDPNLGVYHSYILADIPGIIEGASEGRGLGAKFLRHISRTSVIIHCISLEHDNLLDQYRIIRRELDKNMRVAGIPEYILFTKADVVNDIEIDEKISLFTREITAPLLGYITILDTASVQAFACKLVDLLTSIRD